MGWTSWHDDGHLLVIRGDERWSIGPAIICPGHDGRECGPAEGSAWDTDWCALQEELSCGGFEVFPRIAADKVIVTPTRLLWRGGYDAEDEMTFQFRDSPEGWDLRAAASNQPEPSVQQGDAGIEHDNRADASSRKRPSESGPVG